MTDYITLHELRGRSAMRMAKLLAGVVVVAASLALSASAVGSFYMVPFDGVETYLAPAASGEAV